MSLEKEAREYYKGHESFPLPQQDGETVICDINELIELLSDFATQQTEKLREEIEELKESRQKFAIESTSRLEKLKNIEEQLHYIAFGNYNSIQEVSDELQQLLTQLKDNG